MVDNTGEDGRYKALYLASTKGKHKATVYLHGTPVQNDFMFHVESSRCVDQIIQRRFISHLYKLYN